MQIAFCRISKIFNSDIFGTNQSIWFSLELYRDECLRKKFTEFTEVLFKIVGIMDMTTIFEANFTVF